MQDIAAERAFYDELFSRKPENEHIVGGYDEIHALAMPEVPAGLVLDLGCGTGAHTVRIARRGADVLAVDLTLRGVRAARERLRLEGLAGRFVVADAEHLPLRNGSVLVAWTSLLLHHFPKLDALSRELARTTTGRIVAFEPNAQNALTWFANNVVNRWWGTRVMTPNQRALWPIGLRRRFKRIGFRQTSLHYLHRPWGDRMGWLRRTYVAVTSWLPMRFRANKFLAIFERGVPAGSPGR